jgi:hypothetical protein
MDCAAGDGSGKEWPQAMMASGLIVHQTGIVSPGHVGEGFSLPQALGGSGKSGLY